MPPRILIVGLRQLGTSIGLALGRSADAPTVFGYDRDKAAAAAALEAGAFERRVLDPRKTAGEVDMVVLATPHKEASELMDDLINALKPGAILLDLTPEAHDPGVLSGLVDQSGRIIRGIPVVSAEGLQAPQAPSTADPDLFRGGSIGLAIPPETPEAAIELALSLAEALGASPFFIDPAELEYVLAAVELLPSLLGLMLLQHIGRHPGLGQRPTAGRPSVCGLRRPRLAAGSAAERHSVESTDEPFGAARQPCSAGGDASKPPSGPRPANSSALSSIKPLRRAMTGWRFAWQTSPNPVETPCRQTGASWATCWVLAQDALPTGTRAESTTGRWRYNGRVTECYCYILECSDGSFYTGWTTDPERRLKEHNAGRGARYTRSRRPLKLVYLEPQDDRSTAMRRERAIKSRSRRAKLKLIRSQIEPPSTSGKEALHG